MAVLESDQDQEVGKKVKPESIASRILANLRKIHKFPDNPVKVEAINLYTTRWRVNVWTIGDNNARVEASWFVIADSKGEIVTIR